MPSCTLSRCNTPAPAARIARWVVACIVGVALQASGAPSQPGGIYLIGDDAETIHLSDRAQTPDARLLIATEAVVESRMAAPSAARGSRSGRPAAHPPAPDPGLAAFIDEAARSQRIEPEFLHALIDVESGYAVRAVSPRGAQGLTQLMPATARDYGVSDPFDPLQNVAAGARHLRRLLDRFGQDKTLALAAYNAGPEAVARHRASVPPYAETIAYVPRVMQRFALLLHRAPPGAQSPRAHP